jgi:RHS repeat-associated protein
MSMSFIEVEPDCSYTRRLINQAGANATSYTYSPYGRLTNNSGNNGNANNPFTYTGREDVGLGLSYYRARYYDSSIERFISDDQRYVGGNPLVYKDPMGLIDIFAGVGGEITAPVGVAASTGLVFDTDTPYDSGAFASAAGAVGANVGAGVFGGIAFRDIEGTGYSLGFATLLGSGSILFDDKGFNGLTIGPGAKLGGSFTYGYTATLRASNFCEPVQTKKQKLYRLRIQKSRFAK